MAVKVNLFVCASWRFQVPGFFSSRSKIYNVKRNPLCLFFFFFLLLKSWITLPFCLHMSVFLCLFYKENPGFLVKLSRRRGEKTQFTSPSLKWTPGFLYNLRLLPWNLTELLSVSYLCQILFWESFNITIFFSWTFSLRRTCHIRSSKSYILLHILRVRRAQRAFDFWPPYDITKVKYTTLKQ